MTSTQAPSVARRFLEGVSLLGRGLRLWSTDPRLMLVGALPALVVALVYLAGLVVLLVNAQALSEWATPFADTWDEVWRTSLRLTAALAFVVVGAVLAVYTFTAITLAVGDPFYEKIWRSVEIRLGGIPDEVDVAFWPSLGRGVLDTLRIVALTTLIGFGLFVFGFIPVLGQTLVPLAGAAVAGWFLALELTGKGFEARGRSLAERRRALARIRPTALGFGIASYLIFLIPFGAVFVMPAAVAGATLLAREALDETTTPAL